MDEKSLKVKEEAVKASAKALEALEASVNWPEATHGAEPGNYAPNGMGGTLVYAAWQGRTGSVIPDHLKLSFNANHYILAGAEGPLAEEFLLRGDQVITDLVLIAASSGGIVEVGAEDENGNFSEDIPFLVTREHLSARGLALLEVLEELHGGPATLVTYNSDDRWTDRWH